MVVSLLARAVLRTTRAITADNETTFQQDLSQTARVTKLDDVDQCFQPVDRGGISRAPPVRIIPSKTFSSSRCFFSYITLGYNV